jgi:hypothetical protein
MSQVGVTANLPPWKPTLSPEIVFVVVKGYVSVWRIRFSTTTVIPPVLHTHFVTTFLWEGQAGETWEPSNKAIHLRQKRVFVFFKESKQNPLIKAHELNIMKVLYYLLSSILSWAMSSRMPTFATAAVPILLCRTLEYSKWYVTRDPTMETAILGGIYYEWTNNNAFCWTLYNIATY